MDEVEMRSSIIKVFHRFDSLMMTGLLPWTQSKWVILGSNLPSNCTKHPVKFTAKSVWCGCLNFTFRISVHKVFTVSTLTIRFCFVEDRIQVWKDMDIWVDYHFSEEKILINWKWRTCYMWYVLYLNSSLSAHVKWNIYMWMFWPKDNISESH